MLYAYAFLKKIRLKKKMKIKSRKNKNENKKEENMNILLYVLIFIMGTLFGSFYTLAIYRIPRKIDIVHTNSFCPNCGHKLGFFELFPILSYIALGGKCKQCKQKIKPTYLIIEVLSGITFLLIAFGLNLNIYNLRLNLIIRFAFIVLYLVAIFLIAGIDKENRRIEKGVLYYGFTVSCMYIIYLCIMGEASIYRYVMYLVTLIILLIIDCEKQINEANTSYTLQVLMLLVVMLINTGIVPTLGAIITVGSSIAIVKLVYSLKNVLNKSKKESTEMKKLYRFGFLLGLTNIMIFIGNLYFIYH